MERGEHGDPGSGLTRARAAVERRHDVGNERRGLELSARATKGVRELKRERGKGAVRAGGAPHLLYGREGGGRDR
jgi:hypothetical protein